MSSLLSSLGIDRLSDEDKLRLAEEIWESLGESPDLSIPTEAQRRELDRRVAALDADPGSAIPWDVVEARALARLRP